MGLAVRFCPNGKASIHGGTSMARDGKRRDEADVAIPKARTKREGIQCPEGPTQDRNRTATSLSLSLIFRPRAKFGMPSGS